MLRAIHGTLVAGAALFVVLATPAVAGPVPPSFLFQGVYPPRASFNASSVSGGLVNQWRQQRDYQYQEWQGTAQSYAAALSFARCAARFNPDSIALVDRPIGMDGDCESLARFVRVNRACVGEQSAVSSLLIRAALAETAMNAGAPPRALNVGVPETVDGYPLASVSRCLVQHAPASVAAVLNTRPGDDAERAAAQKLFLEVPDCVPRRTIWLSPTAARLALIDAVYRQGPSAR